MDAITRRTYERHAKSWIAARKADRNALARARWVCDGAADGGRIGDVGSGPGWYAAAIAARGRRAIALELSRAMLRAGRERGVEAARVCADAAALPLARGSLSGAVAFNVLQHLPHDQIALALAHLHDALGVDARLAFTLADLDSSESAAGPNERRRGWARRRFRDAALGGSGRLFTYHSRECVRALCEGAGFDDVRIDRPRGSRAFWLWVRARRAHTLPDYVRPGLELLVCGLNPSRTSAATGIPYGRKQNRFWPAALAAGLVERGFDPFAAVRAGVGFTDLVKRTTARASELDTEEYRRGLARVEALVRRARPGAVCFVGLDGWRRALDPEARPGWVERGFGGRPAYLMPSTSGLNARTSLAELARHLTTAAGRRSA